MKRVMLRLKCKQTKTKRLFLKFLIEIAVPNILVKRS